MASLFKKIKKITGNENAFTLSDDNPYEVKEWIDSGSYILNAVLSDGDIFKGLAVGKRYMLSGESGTAKSLFTSFLIKSYLDNKKNSYVVCFESEGSSTVDMAISAGISEDQIIILPVTTIEQCRTEIVRILDKIIESNNGKEEKDQENCIFVIDSLGNLSTRKETEDCFTGSEKKDMTRAALLRGFSRVTSLKFSLAKTPIIIVNHSYASVGSYVPTQVVGGGMGPKYMSDCSLILSKTLKRNDANKKEILGVSIKVKVDKSRYMQEGTTVKIDIDFKKGMNKYSGMYEYAKEHILKKEGFSHIFPDGSKVKMKDVRDNFEKYCTKDMLKLIGDKIKEEFSFG